MKNYLKREKEKVFLDDEEYISDLYNLATDSLNLNEHTRYSVSNFLVQQIFGTLWFSILAFAGFFLLYAFILEPVLLFLFPVKNFSIELQFLLDEYLIFIFLILLIIVFWIFSKRLFIKFRNRFILHSISLGIKRYRIQLLNTEGSLNKKEFEEFLRNELDKSLGVFSTINEGIID